MREDQDVLHEGQHGNGHPAVLGGNGPQSRKYTARRRGLVAVSARFSAAPFRGDQRGGGDPRRARVRRRAVPGATAGGREHRRGRFPVRGSVAVRGGSGRLLPASCRATRGGSPTAGRLVGEHRRARVRRRAVPGATAGGRFRLGAPGGGGDFAAGEPCLAVGGRSLRRSPAVFGRRVAVGRVGGSGAIRGGWGRFLPASRRRAVPGRPAGRRRSPAAAHPRRHQATRGGSPAGAVQERRDLAGEPCLAVGWRSLRLSRGSGLGGVATGRAGGSGAIRGGGWRFLPASCRATRGGSPTAGRFLVRRRGRSGNRAAVGSSGAISPANPASPSVGGLSGDLPRSRSAG